MTDTFETPAWVHHAVFYQIFPDRFAKSKKIIKPNNLEPWLSPPTPKGYKGGDLLGIFRKIRLPAGFRNKRNLSESHIPVRQ